MSAVRRCTWPIDRFGSIGFGAGCIGGTSPWGRLVRASTGAVLLRGELGDALRRARERLGREQVRRGVRDVVHGGIELIGAGGGVERVAERDLVANDQHRLLVEAGELPERLCVAARGLVQALAGGKAVGPRVRTLPDAVVLDRAALEVADANVVEERLCDHGYRPAAERDRGGFIGGRPTRGVEPRAGGGCGVGARGPGPGPP